MDQTFDDRLHQFVTTLQAEQDAYMQAHYPTLDKDKVEVEMGIKLIRIVKQGSQRMVYCFIDKSNGDILKAEGYRKPAKGKRGSIWNENCDVGEGKPCDHYGGGLYIRR